MVKLKVKNFGPIKEGFSENDGFMDISPITLFCGNQATGKSTIAKLFSTFTWLEKAVFRNDYDEASVANKEFFINFLKNQRIHEYIKDNSEIVYIGNACIFSYVNNNFSVSVNEAQLKNYIRPKIMYIPAERNLLTILEDADKIQKLPVMLSILLERYRNARKKLAQDPYSLPISNIKIKYDSINNITSVFSDNSQVVDISNSSSGIQSITPLSLISDYLAKSVTQDVFSNIQKLSVAERDKIKKDIQQFNDKELADTLLKELNMYFLAGSKQGISEKNVYLMKTILQYYFNQCFINIVEEPEQNLFPESQNKVLYHLLECFNRNPNNQLMITTHSPYIISYLTLCAKAYELKSKGINLEKISTLVPIESIVSGKTITIYETNEDGRIELLKPYESLPSDENLLNKLMAKQNDLFNKLLEMEEE